MTQNIIFYPVGCYGTFIEWTCNFLDGKVHTVPFNQNGNSHKFKGNIFINPDDFLEHVNSSNELKYCRTHPDFSLHDNINLDTVSYYNFLQDEIDVLCRRFDKILIITFNNKTALTFNNNIFKKLNSTELECNEKLTDKIKWDINLRIKNSHFYLRDNLIKWGKSTIFDFDIWELREFVSMFWFQTHNSKSDVWNKIFYQNKNNNKIEFIFIDEFSTKFDSLIDKLIKHFDIKTTEEKIIELKTIYKDWRILQTEIDKDEIVALIVNSIINNKELNWAEHKLSLLDEAFIQKSLRDNGIDLKCYRLNEFPTNSKDFQVLIEKT